MKAALTLLQGGAFKTRKHVCSICGKEGHNKASCARIASESESQRAERERVREHTKNYYRSSPERRREVNERVRADRVVRPEIHRIATLEWKYKINFDAMWRSQRGLCAICHKPMTPSGCSSDSVAVDHDHGCCAGMKSCGECVRGLVHRNCNMCIGAAKEDVELLRQAIEYLEKRKAHQ